MQDVPTSNIHLIENLTETKPPPYVHILIKLKYATQVNHQLQRLLFMEHRQVNSGTTTKDF